jgi:hypothetical protein
MPGEGDLMVLLRNLSPILSNEEYVFTTLSGSYGDYTHLEPLSSFNEKEGLTLIIPKRRAVENAVDFESTFKVITLEIHSSLNAVGLTAAVAAKLAKEGISANVVAAFYHDHIFVQTEKAEIALKSLIEFN